MSSTTGKTKDWFKNQLVTHGVPLPSASAKKEEYQRLYDEQVLPHQGTAEFSSDDDTEPIPQAPPPRTNSVPKNSKPDAKKDAGEPPVDRRASWVQALTDKNLFVALCANERSPGPIVDSTRDFYRKMLLDILVEDDRKTLNNIEQYLADNKEAREHWQETGLDLHGFNGVTNGNTENGFSDDTDEDEAIETASRASRSSRASSKRATPVKSFESTPKTPKSPFESKTIRSRPSASVRAGLNLQESMGVNQPEMIASTSRSESLLYNRMSSSYTTGSSRIPYRPLSSMRPIRYDEQDEDDEPMVVLPRKAKASWKSPKLLLQCLLTFIVFIIVPLAIYLFVSQNKQNSCQEDGTDCPDELDALLKSLDDQEGVPDSGN